MKEKTYETDNDYLLDVLEKEEEEIENYIREKIPKTISFEFSKLLAIKNIIHKINIEQAFEKGLYNDKI